MCWSLGLRVGDMGSRLRLRVEGFGCWFSSNEFQVSGFELEFGLRPRCDSDFEFCGDLSEEIFNDAG